MAIRLLEAPLVDQIVTVEIDEIFENPNPYRKHRFALQQEIEGWLDESVRAGSYWHRERKIRANDDRSVVWTTEEINQHGPGEIIGYRHRYYFTDHDTAFLFKLQFGSNLIRLG